MKKAKGMARGENIVAQERFAEGVNSGTFDVFNDVVAPDAVEHDPAPGQGRGPEGFKHLFGTLRSAFSDLEVTPEHVTVTDGDDVALAYTVRGTHRGDFLGVAPTGRDITARGVQIGRFENGELVERRAPLTSSPSSSSSAPSRRRRGRRRA